MQHARHHAGEGLWTLWCRGRRRRPLGVAWPKDLLDGKEVPRIQPPPPPRDVLERGVGGWGGVWLRHPPFLGPPRVPAEGGPKKFKLKSSLRQRHRSKILAVSLKHWKGRRGQYIPAPSPATPPPPPRSSEKNPTFRRNVPASRFFSKRVPSAQDLLPGAQTHLPFGCSVVGVMWKPKAALNLPKNISSLGLYMVPDQWYVGTCHWSSGICTGLQVGKRVFKPR